MSNGDAYVLGEDPGTTTGLAVVRFDMGREGEPSTVWAEQLEWAAACERVSWWLERLYEKKVHQDARVAAVCEKFVVNANTASRGQQGSEDTLGMIGVTRYICGLTSVEFAKPQHASAAKTLVGDDTLKNLRMYSPGLMHANDACKHAILLAVKRHWMSPGWLALGEATRK